MYECGFNLFRGGKLRLEMGCQGGGVVQLREFEWVNSSEGVK